MVKPAPTIYVCQSCGHQSRKWLGRCPDCGEWNSLVEERVIGHQGSKNSSLAATALTSALRLRKADSISYADVESQDEARISSGIAEFDRVLGGGIVAGSLILIGGEPGIGKSTLLLQVADCLSHEGLSVLYISGEESERQIKMRGERLHIIAQNLLILPETNLDQIFEEIKRIRPAAVIVDSIQTVFSPGIESAPGSISQIRGAASQFLLVAKSTGVPFFLIGHINKDGAIAGPKALEHIVDTVLYFEGERHQNHRIVRATKNRYGAANELGVFEMTGEGLCPVANPSQMFLHERPTNVAGSVVTACIEGTRPVLVEIQALVSGTKYGTGKRMTQGFDAGRVALLIAMLEKRVGFHLLEDDIFVNVVGGLEVNEPAADLGVVAAIASSFKNLTLDQHTAVCGEIGLTGEIRSVNQSALRAREAQALGFSKIVLPRSNASALQKLTGLRVVGVASVEEALDELF